ncbi:peptidylprolyl isomerase [soil metagenome]
MLAAIRQFSKSWIAIALFVVLLIALVVSLGQGNRVSGVLSADVVMSGSHKMSGPEFDKVFKGNLEQISQKQGGQPIPAEDAAKAGFHDQLLQQIAHDMAMAEAVKRLGINPSPKLISAEIEKIPDAVDPVTGKFDEKAFRELLARNNVTIAQFRSDASDQYALNHFAAAIQVGFKTPRTYAALAALNRAQNRSWSSFTLDPAKAAKPPAPTDAQLQAFMTELGDRMKKPETRELSIVRFSTKAAEPGVKIDEAEVKKYFDFKKGSLSQPETRNVVQIPLKTMALAQTAAGRLAKGEDPTAVAKSMGVTPIVYAGKPKTAISDKKVADAAFSLQAGQSSGPIQGDLGFAVVKVSEIIAGKEPSIEDLRKELEAQIRHDTAQKQVYATAEAFDKAREGGASIADAAKTAKVAVVESGPVAQNGRNPSDKTGAIAAGVSPGLIGKAFEMSPGETSDLEDEGQGEYYAVKVTKVNAAAMRTLDEVRVDLTKAYVEREQAKLLQKQADTLSARVRKGESLEAVAASAGIAVDHFVGVDPETAKTKMDLYGGPVLQQVFTGSKGDVFVTQNPKGGIVIGKVDSIVAGAMGKMAPMVEQARAGMAQEVLGGVFEETKAGAYSAIKPKVDSKRALQAIGVDPAVINPPKDKDKGKAAEKPKAKG